MRRVLAAAVWLGAFAAIACGGGDGGDGVAADCIPTISSENFETVHPPEGTSMSLQQARQYADWIRIPDDLPDDVSIKAWVHGYLPCAATIRDVDLSFEGPGFYIGLSEHRRSRDTNPFATAVSIGGSEGELRVQDNGIAIFWSRNGVVYKAFLNSGSNMTQERFVQILESIPE